MIRTLSSIFLIFSLFAGLSCTSADPVTGQLRDYIGDRFGLGLPVERTYFVLIPSGQCPNCIRYNGDLLGTRLNRKTMIISGFNADHFRNFTHYYHDTANYLERLPIVDYNNKIFVVEQEKVVKVMPVTNLFDQLDRLEQPDVLAQR